MSEQSEVIAAGMVQRWHTVPGLNQTIAEHSWGVAMLVLLQHPTASRELLAAALLHDIHEVVIGDIPSPAKIAIPELIGIESKIRNDFLNQHSLTEPLLNSNEKAILKKADKLEALLFVMQQADVNKGIIDRLKELLAKLEEES